MKEGASAFVWIGGFGAATATLGALMSFAAAILTPAPELPRMAVRVAAAAMRQGDGTRARLTVGIEPLPTGMRAPLIEEIFAQQMGVERARVRAVWVGWDAGQRTSASTHVVRVTHADGSTAETVSQAPPAISPGMLQALARLPQPPFAAAISIGDSRWRIVRPYRPWFTRWQARFALGVAFCLLLLLPLSWLVAHRITRPLRRLADAADRDCRLPEPSATGWREARLLAAAMNRMQDRILGSVAERSRMLTAVAHDLRTPLTSLAIRAETAPAVQRRRMLEDIRRMETMIRDVIEYSAPATTTHTVTDVTRIVRQRCSDAAFRGGQVDLATAQPISAAVDAIALGRALDNLIVNAVTYAGAVRVSVSRSGNSVRIQVEDEGPGIDIDDIPRLLLPFERGEVSRNRATGGAGLGLSIVQRFADEHDGRFAIQRNPRGGVSAELSFRASNSE